MIEVSDAWWRLAGRVDGQVVVSSSTTFDEQEGIDGQADAIRDALEQRDYRGEPVLLALDSALCLSATLELDRPHQLRDRQAMLYRLEEWIPWAAEDIAADFADTGGTALAVAAIAAPLRRLVEQLEQQGVRVLSIVPSALLAGLEHIRRQSSAVCHLAAWQQDEGLDLLRADGGRITDWAWLPADARSLRQELDWHALRSRDKLAVVTYRLDPSLTAAIAGCTDCELVEPEETDDLSRADAAFETAQRILSGAEESPIELRRGTVGTGDRGFAVRRHLWAMKAAAALLLVAVSVALLLRAHRYTILAEDLAAEQATVYQQVFPNKRVPVGIRSRLESELTQLHGVRGETGEVAETIPALLPLKRLLEALPADRRFRLAEMRIEEGRLYLDGEVREHSDAEAIAELLREQGFNVASPRTHRVDGRTVSFRITGQYQIPTSDSHGGQAT